MVFGLYVIRSGRAAPGSVAVLQQAFIETATQHRDSQPIQVACCWDLCPPRSVVSVYADDWWGPARAMVCLTLLTAECSTDRTCCAGQHTFSCDEIRTLPSPECFHGMFWLHSLLRVSLWSVSFRPGLGTGCFSPFESAASAPRGACKQGFAEWHCRFVCCPLAEVCVYGLFASAFGSPLVPERVVCRLAPGGLTCEITAVGLVGVALCLGSGSSKHGLVTPANEGGESCVVPAG
jgi:hypothetical protein